MIYAVKNHILKRKTKKPILIDIFYKKTPSQKPIVIFCHGYKGFKDWGAWHLVAQQFAEAGFIFVKFNFSHNGGTIENPIDFPDLEAFGNNNYTKELDDLNDVITYITNANHEALALADFDQITVIGHSRGGGITLLQAHEDPRITKIVTWAGVSDYKSRFPKKEQFKKWEERGVYYVVNGRTQQKMPHYFQYYTSFIEQEERLTISKAAKKIKIPYLIIHGTKDLAVSHHEAEQLHHWNPKSTLLLIPDANHVFGAKHPWVLPELPSDLLTVVKNTIDFARL